MLTTTCHHAWRYARTLIRKQSHNHSMTNNVLRIIKNNSIRKLLVKTMQGQRKTWWRLHMSMLWYVHIYETLLLSSPIMNVWSHMKTNKWGPTYTFPTTRRGNTQERRHYGGQIIRNSVMNWVHQYWGLIPQFKTKHKFILSKYVTPQHLRFWKIKIMTASIHYTPVVKKKKFHGLSPRANYTDRAAGEVSANFCG